MTTAHNRAVLGDAQERADSALRRVPETDWDELDEESTGAYTR